MTQNGRREMLLLLNRALLTIYADRDGIKYFGSHLFNQSFDQLIGTPGLIKKIKNLIDGKSSRDSIQSSIKSAEGKSHLFQLELLPLFQDQTGEPHVLLIATDPRNQTVPSSPPEQESDISPGFFDEMIEGIQILDHDLVYLYLNSVAVTQSQRSERELLGKKFDRVWPSINETPLYKQMTACLKTRTPTQFDNKFVFLDGSERWFRLSIQPVSAGILILSLDVTDEKQADIKLHEQIDELQRWYHATLGREERVIELKQEVNRLLIESGRPPRYGGAQEVD